MDVGTGRHRLLQDSDSDSDSEHVSGKTNILSAAKAADLCPKPYRLIAQGQAFTALDDLSTLSQLDYVDLSDNSLTSLEGLAGLPRLKTLIAKRNKLSTFDRLRNLQELRILNLAENEYVSTDWLLGATCKNTLMALILNGNRIVDLDAIAALSNLETLVVSHNDIEDIQPLGRLPKLKKLSASHNRIRAVPASISACRSLTELRLGHNRIATLPASNVLAQLSSLRILDLGHNRLTSLESLAALQQTLTHLNATGNPALSQHASVTEAVLSLCPKLEIVDGARISGGRRKVRLNRERRLAVVSQKTIDSDSPTVARHSSSEIASESRKNPHLKNISANARPIPKITHRHTTLKSGSRNECCSSSDFSQNPACDHSIGEMPQDESRSDDDAIDAGALLAAGGKSRLVVASHPSNSPVSVPISSTRPPKRLRVMRTEEGSSQSSGNRRANPLKFGIGGPTAWA